MFHSAVRALPQQNGRSAYESLEAPPVPALCFVGEGWPYPLWWPCEEALGLQQTGSGMEWWHGSLLSPAPRAGGTGEAVVLPDREGWPAGSPPVEERDALVHLYRNEHFVEAGQLINE